MNNNQLKNALKRWCRDFHRDTDGAVMGEYVILGLFAFCLCVVGVMAFGLTHTWQLSNQISAASGETQIVLENKKDSKFPIIDYQETTTDYMKNVLGYQSDSMGHKEANLENSIGLDFNDD